MNKRLRKWGVFMESEEKNIYTEEKKVYTIEDIARELGVSKTTVSRAISGKGRIGQATGRECFSLLKSMITVPM